MKKHLALSFAFIWPLLKYAFLTAALLVVLILILLSSAYRDLKNAAAGGLEGKAEISAAVMAAQAQNWPAALSGAERAQILFTTALEDLNRTRRNPAVKNIGVIRTQINDLEYLLKTAEILSRSLGRTVPLIQELDNILSGAASRNFIDLPASDKSRFLQLIYESEPELNGLKANLNLAVLNLNKIHRIGVLWPIYRQISDIKQELSQTAALMDKTVLLVKLLPALAGYPDMSRFLLILQNNDELRPTGGFIGVYGILEIQNGEIVSLKTDDSYHLDMPSSLNNWNLEPPAPLKKYLKVEKWYLRDANWSPDWPTAAKQIEEIYNGEIKSVGQPVASFIGVIAINPDLTADLIRLVGPIMINGETYDADNFQPLLQYNVEVAYKDQNISSWDRKEIINELMDELKKRLFNLPSGNWSELLKTIDRNISAKNIQIYFKNADWENLAQSLRAGGEVKNTAGDYLLVVDSNLGSFKSDAVIKKKISYVLTEEKNGLNELSATVKLNYRHEGGFDWRTTRYRNYTRVYAPLGSRLISLNGLNETTADFSEVDDKDLNKTVFGFFWTIEPGATGEISLNYRLPTAIQEQFTANQYQLLMQKQAGQRLEGLEIIVNRLNKKPLNFRTDLETERVFILNK